MVEYICYAEIRSVILPIYSLLLVILFTSVQISAIVQSPMMEKMQNVLHKLHESALYSPQTKNSSYQHFRKKIGGTEGGKLQSFIYLFCYLEVAMSCKYNTEPECISGDWIE